MAGVDMSVFDAMEYDAQRRHDRIVDKATGKARPQTRPEGSIIVQSSMPREQKERFTAAAKAHGISMSAFIRLACDEYIKNHGWE